MNAETPSSAPFFDVAIAGAGPAGMSAALFAAQAGLSTVLIGPQAPKDFRTSALMAGSCDLLQQAGVWPHCLDKSAPLERLRIIDDTGRLIRAPESLFHAAEAGEDAFAWNLANNDLVHALTKASAAQDGLERIEDVVSNATPCPDRVELQLSNGEAIAARAVLACDGRRSALRDIAGISTREWRYPQVAVVMNITHTSDHNYTSTEFHRTTGPFTLVPLPGNRSAVVAVEDAAGAEMLMGLDDNAMAKLLEERSHRILGSITVEPGRASFPLGGLVPKSYARNRIFIGGEAAHVVPPIGAQGLNLGLRDGAVFAQIAAQFSADPGCDEAQRAYDRARRPDIESRSTMIDLLNRSLLSPYLPAQMARAAGLAAISSIPPLRQLFMQEGMEHGGRRAG